MGLKEIRAQNHLSQRELAQRSGVNFRSLQDYEQGHKKLTSASGDTLLRLSTVLGCTTEELLLEDFEGAELLPHNRMNVREIQSQRLFCEKYRTAGRWICNGSEVATMFYFNGEQYILPFRAIFTPAMLPGLREAAALQIEARIESLQFAQQGFESW